jgi:hypothetical protein
MIFTENKEWFQDWRLAVAIRTTSDSAYSVAASGQMNLNILN